MNTEELTTHIKAAKAGDQEAFAFLYDAFSERLHRFIRYRISDYHHSEDILQEVFIKIWKGLPSYDSDVGSFATWVYRITTNAVNDFLRKAYRQPEPVELSEDLTLTVSDRSDERLDTYTALQMVKDHFTRMPAQYQTVLELRFMQDLSVEETARALDKTAVAIRVLQHRALKRLKKLLDDHAHTT